MVTGLAKLEEILPLRQAVIIEGTDRDSPYFPGDNDPGTCHVGVFENGKCIGCGTFLRSEWEGAPAWKLRGMATDPEWRNRGVGREVLIFAEQVAAESGIRIFWCNARQTAAPFYEKLGWTIVSELFDVPGIGPHYTMMKRA
jgi:GNAT superfamily N-acetyltransferase